MINELATENAWLKSGSSPPLSFETFDEVSVTKAPSLEPFVSAEVVADFLNVTRRQVLDWARGAVIPAHPLGCGKRRIWRFRLSEITTDVLSRKKAEAVTIPCGSPRSQRRKL